MTEMDDVPIAIDIEASAAAAAATAAANTTGMEVENTVEENDETATNKTCRSKYCGWMNFQGVTEAKGYAILGTARGAVVMSNIFLSTSLIYLASEEAGCIDENGEAIPDCENTVHGFRPPSLIANIAVISGLLSALFMPFIGAIVDYTPYRRATGIIAAILIILIQSAQVPSFCS
jgi:MFS-type transporter involved in bile tolerance (Atg22 family)